MADNDQPAPPPSEEMEDDAPAEGAPAWMATFADLATLLLTFFVLLLSFANMNVIQFKLALGSVKDALGVITQKPGYFEGHTTNPIEWESQDSPSTPKQNVPNHIIQMRQMIQQRKLDGAMKLIITEDHIILRVHDLFASGSSDIAPDKFEQMDIIGRLVKMHTHPVQIEAHTDNRPIHSGRYPSNWELSASRAGAVARYLVLGGEIDAGRLNPGGYAHYRPLTDNKTEAGRRQNRRLDVVLSRQNDTAAQMNNSGSW
ncbi:MAG: OmpA family protein [Myxococcales bacterium]|nr:OmpA family protein [Myxococcales bacterium]